MADTNFAAMNDEQITAWGREVWRVARNNSFLMRFAGSGSNSMVQRITELSKTKAGARAIMTLVADLAEDGAVGDNELEGMEEAMRNYTCEINIDQLRHANRLAGRMADQKTIVNFRRESRDKLGYWLANRLDQLGFLTASGIEYTKTNKGADRAVKQAGYNLSDLAFAADVKAPTANRHIRWSQASQNIEADGDTSAITADDTLTYRSLVLAHAFARDNYVKGIKAGNGEELYHVFVTPTGMAQLRLDPDFLANVRNAGPRGSSNQIFQGATSFLLDGLMIHQYRDVYSNVNAGSGNMWGADGGVRGQRALICGAQALGLCDLGPAYWDEKPFDYGNKQGISVGKMFGLVKPQFHSDVTGTKEDFGTIVLDTAL